MGRRRRRRPRGRRDTDEQIPLLRKDGSQKYTNMTENQDEEQDQSDESNKEAGPSTGSNGKLRLMVLGGDDALIDKACGTILRKRNRKTAFKCGKLEPANACGRQVSVLKTPFTWLEKLKSYLFFSRGVKAIRNEIESYESMMFPGPHAFLLVHRDVKDSGRENYLLRALSDVFGKEVLDYCMVLFMYQAKHNDPKKNYCLKMCGGRNHILHNNDDSVKKLFEKIETMTERKNIFFTNHLECFRKASNYFQEEYVEKENKQRKELNDSKDRENQLSKELNDSKDREKQSRKELNDSKDRENQLRKELNDSKDRENQLRKELNDSKDRENQLRKELNDSKDREKQLRKELNDSKDRENQLRKELNDSKDREKQLRKELNDSKDRENQLRKELNDSNVRENQLKDDKDKLQRKVEQLNEKKKHLKNNLSEAEAKVKETFLLSKLQSESNIIQGEKKVQAKEKELNERERELDRRVKELDDRKKELDDREREVTQRDVSCRDHHLQATADPAVSRDKISPLDEREGQLKSRDDSQASGSPGTQKPVRRNSKELQPPDMSEHEHRPLDTL